LDDDDSTNDLLDPVKDAKFLADAEKEAEGERVAHVALDAEMEHRRVAAAAEDDSSDISWSSDDPDAPEERTAEQRAFVDSFETLKKVEDATNDTLRQCLLEDAAAQRALAATRQAAEKQTREGRNDGAGPSGNK
jgi:ethanolamine ammonia-lyase large subunit